MNLQIHSIFRSVSGEYSRAFPQGALTTFVRLQGCNLRCSYCDTVRAQEVSGGREMTPEEVMKEVMEFGGRNVLITGGEPLLQQLGLTELVIQLRVEGLQVAVETNGSFFPSDPITRVLVNGWTVDYKLPRSGQEDKMLPPGDLLIFPSKTTVIKFVCCDRVDFNRALEVRKEINDKLHVPQPLFAFSPTPSLPPALLVGWMKEEAILLDDILNIQIHKHIWPQGEEEGTD